ncbi:MAG: GNAT family N-acetyltransferase [Pseudomonadota bacterium]|nr:GNAT family N-acetyltransferase [Pseudomonadota bacterium]
MSFQIRPASLLDLHALTALFDGYRQFYGQPPDLARAGDFLAERIGREQSLILIAQNESGEALGFTQLYPAFSSVRMVRTWLLNDLFVAPPARRQGVAASLLREAAELARARGAASLSLSTALDNVAAQALYESLGWVRDRQFCEYALSL